MKKILQAIGAFLGDQWVGDLGISYDGSIGRCQNVRTRTDFRRKGICGTLAYEAAKISLSEFKVRTLASEADAEYRAAKIHESVRFRPTEWNHRLSLLVLPWDAN